MGRSLLARGGQSSFCSGLQLIARRSPTLWRFIYFAQNKSTNLNVNFIQNTFTETSGVKSDQMSGHYGATKPTHKISVTEGITDPSLTSLFLSRALFNTCNTAVTSSEPQVAHVTALLKTPQCPSVAPCCPRGCGRALAKTEGTAPDLAAPPSDLHGFPLSHWTPAVGRRYRRDRNSSH